MYLRKRDSNICVIITRLLLLNEAIHLPLLKSPLVQITSMLKWLVDLQLKVIYNAQCLMSSLNKWKYEIIKGFLYPAPFLIIPNNQNHLKHMVKIHT